MRRTRRHKYLQLAVFFLIYSIIHVVSLANKGTENDEHFSASKDDNSVHHDVIKSVLHQTANSLADTKSGKLPQGNKNDETDSKDEQFDIHKHLGMLTSHQTHSALVKNVSKGESKDESEAVTERTANETDKYAIHKHLGLFSIHQTHDSLKKNGTSITNGKESIGKNNKEKNKSMNPAGDHITQTATDQVNPALGKNSTGNVTAEEKCTTPAIQQFPHPIMSQNARRHGGLIIHILVAIYMFLGLAIVCDEYFVASLDRICEELKMAPDVAGATFMAAGSSAPELATVVVGVFFAKDDIGISGVIGSAVFNIMFVIACCGLCSATAVYLNWWPLIRDCFFYALSILVMLAVIYDENITWVESLIMLLTYCVYCVVLHFNTPLEKWAHTLPLPFKSVTPTEESGLVSYKTLEDDGKHQNYGMERSPEKQQQQQQQEYGDQGLKNFGMEWSPEKHQQEGFANQLSGPALNQATSDVPPPPAAPAKPVQQNYYKPKEYDPSTQVDPLKRPETGGIFVQALWAIVFPIHYLCRKSMPDCRSEKYRNWYPFTFFISMVWISFYSYFMVWMITVIGYTLGIPDTVMGLTFVAAGVSVPDALSSIAVIKEGYGDMAVSNAVGSNVFDILICLGLPWFLKTVFHPSTTVKVISRGLTYSTLSLLSTVVFLVVATHFNGWKLDRKYGMVLMIWYLIFIIFASLYELNVFGQMNPPECFTDW